MTAGEETTKPTSREWVSGILDLGHVNLSAPSIHRGHLQRQLLLSSMHSVWVRIVEVNRYTPQQSPLPAFCKVDADPSEFQEAIHFSQKSIGSYVGSSDSWVCPDPSNQRLAEPQEPISPKLSLRMGNHIPWQGIDIAHSQRIYLNVPSTVTVSSSCRNLGFCLCPVSYFN